MSAISAEETLQCQDRCVYTPLRRLMVDGDLDTTTGPRFSGSGLPQSIAKGSIPVCLGYVLIDYIRLLRSLGFHITLRKDDARGKPRSVIRHYILQHCCCITGMMRIFIITRTRFVHHCKRWGVSGLPVCCFPRAEGWSRAHRLTPRLSFLTDCTWN